MLALNRVTAKSGVLNVPIITHEGGGGVVYYYYIIEGWDKNSGICVRLNGGTDI
jgi:hypothetical protein